MVIVDFIDRFISIEEGFTLNQVSREDTINAFQDLYKDYPLYNTEQERKIHTYYRRKIANYLMVLIPFSR